MHALDYAILLGYVLVSAVIGAWAGRREKGAEGFFLGSRSVPWPAVCISIIATSLSAATFLGGPASTFKADGDLYLLQFWIGSFIGCNLIALLFLGAYYRGNVTTVYEFLEQRFGPRSRDAGTIFFFVTRCTAEGVRLLFFGMALSVVLDISLWLCIGLAVIAALLYTVAGGIKAVIWTDIAQVVVLFGGMGLCIGYIIYALPNGFADVSSTLAAAKAGGHDKLNVLHLDELWDLNSSKSLIAGVLCSAAITLAALGTDQDLVQRMLTCKDARSSRIALVLTGILNLPIQLVFLGLGLLLFTWYQVNPLPEGTEVPANKIFPHFIVNELPTGLRGILVAGVFASAMSTLDSGMGGLASSFVNDVARRSFAKDWDDERTVRLARWSIAGMALVLTGIAFLMHQIQSPDVNVIVFAFQLVSYTYGAMLGLFLVAVLTKRGRDAGNWFAMLTSVVLLLELRFGVSKDALSWQWYITIGTLWTFFVAVAFDPSPEPDESGTV